ncbi:hypothetical protein JCM18920_3496 [Cutibacterium acnes JCM 18920]|nr:hypothetical protein JCM18920_3496 [Cutibacterium acnes JCM 18920]
MERKVVVGRLDVEEVSGLHVASRSALGGQGRGLDSHLNGDAGRVNKKVLR